MSPFFLKQYVKGHSSDVFKDYPQLLTEMALRLPYQVQKHSCAPITFEQVCCPHSTMSYEYGLLNFLCKLLLALLKVIDKYKSSSLARGIQKYLGPLWNDLPQTLVFGAHKVNVYWNNAFYENRLIYNWKYMVTYDLYIRLYVMHCIDSNQYTHVLNK